MNILYKIWFGPQEKAYAHIFPMEDTWTNPETKKQKIRNPEELLRTWKIPQK